MKYSYKALYEKNAAFLASHPRIKKALIFYNHYATYFFFAAYLLLWGYGFFDKDFTAKDFTKIFFVPMLAVLITSTIRLTVTRARPYSPFGAGITPVKDKDSDGNSFPSRHLTCASVIALCLFSYLPAVGIMLTVLSIGLGYSRFALGWHYPSDLIVGFCIGLASGCLMFVL